MKILVITRNAWDDTNSIGNTISNFFAKIEGIEFANIYFRESSPSNQLCNLYYRTSEIDVLKNWFSPRKIGRSFVQNLQNASDNEVNISKKEKKIIRFIQKHSINMAYRLSDYIWYSNKWLNENLKSFIDAYSPDMIFTFVKSAPQYYLTVKYLRENYNVPLLSWIADDEYTCLANNNSQREIQNLRYILNESAVVKGCSEEICDYYNTVFGCNATPFYKSCELTTSTKTSSNNPIKFVYAGNLLYGRLDIIRKFADILEYYSENGTNACFEIYSNTTLQPEEVKRYFGDKVCTKYMGKKNYDFIKERLFQADIVLHVESFDKSQILKTKYSFSTKIIDYLQSGSVLLAIGPAEISSMRYIQRIQGAYIINDLDDMQSKVGYVLNDVSAFTLRSSMIREFAQQNHNADIIAKELSKTMSMLIKGEK